MPEFRLVLPLGAAAALLAAVGAASSSAAVFASQAPSAAADVDTSACGSCHDKAVSGMQGTAHSSLPARCGSCHEGTAAHLKAVLEGAEAPLPTVPHPGKTKPAAARETCLGCHDKGRQANFTGGVHDRRGVACASCHSVHDFRSVRSQLRTSRDAETCYTCHAPIRARAMRTSHHPVREGLMGCGSCHDPHDGTRPKMVSADWVNEKCLSCHTEKRGPFLWEHAPVRENCLNCHDPHGSNHDKLLVAKQPYLCQRCHLNTRHPGTLYDARNTLAGVSVSNRLVEHACRNCHQNVHGSNAPSGPYLGR